MGFGGMKREILLDTGKSQLFVIRNFSPNFFEEVSKLTLNFEPEIIVWGSVKRQRRNVNFYSNVSEGYRYSNQIMKSSPLKDEFMISLMEKVNTELNFKTNGVLVNEYTDGTKIVGAHSDSEINLDSSYVAAISYGATRKFRVRKIGEKGFQDFDHEPCSLLVMAGDFQKEFTHEIPVQKKISDVRYSLTFRKHIK